MNTLARSLRLIASLLILFLALHSATGESPTPAGLLKADVDLRSKLEKSIYQPDKAPQQPPPVAPVDRSQELLRVIDRQEKLIKALRARIAELEAAQTPNGAALPAPSPPPNPQ